MAKISVSKQTTSKSVNFKMKPYIAIVFLCLVSFAFGQRYTTKFDSVDIDNILASDRLLQNYVNCLNGSGKCTPDGSELKRNLPDALETGCEKCSEKQREGSKKIVDFLVNQRPKMWDELKSIYDPTGKYTKKYKNDFDALAKNSK